MSLMRSLAPSAPTLQGMLSSFHRLNWVLRYLDSLLSISETSPRDFVFLLDFKSLKASATENADLLTGDIPFSLLTLPSPSGTVFTVAFVSQTWGCYIICVQLKEVSEDS